MDIISSKPKAYYQGLQAGNWFESQAWVEFRTKDDCPYSGGSEDRGDWIRGWNDGRRLADKQYTTWKMQ